MSIISRYRVQRCLSRPILPPLCAHTTSIHWWCWWYRRLCTAYRQKTATLEKMSISPCPPSWTERTTALSQCYLDQKKFTIVIGISSIRDLGGFRPMNLCQSIEVMILFTTRTLPLYDNWGSSHVHLSSLARTKCLDQALSVLHIVFSFTVVHSKAFDTCLSPLNVFWEFR